MSKRLKILLPTFIIVSMLTACLDEPKVSEAAQFMAYTVDVEKVLSKSNAAKAGQEHLAKVRKVLEEGYAKLDKALAKDSEAERRKGLTDAAVALQRQMNIEQQAVTNVISQMMLAEVQAWRKTNKADLILPRQNALDASPGIDITDEIILAMDKKNPKFADLPKVTVNSPEAKTDPKTAQDPKSRKTQRQDRQDRQEKRDAR